MADEDDEPPLDPAVERIRLRLKRLMLVSVATLMIGLVAVIIAVLYKVGPMRDKPALAAAAGETLVDGVLPPGSRLISTALDGRTMTLTFEDGGKLRVVIVDIERAKVLRRLVLGSGAPPDSP